MTRMGLLLDSDSFLSRLDEVPHTRLLVHCASGFRTAASLPDRAGPDVVPIDDDDGNAAEAGYAVTSS